MLGPAAYLLGALWLAALLCFALLGATALRKLLLPGWAGPPAWLAIMVLSSCLLLWTAELLGTFALFKPVPYLLGIAAAGLGLRLGVTRRETAAQQPASLSLNAATLICFLIAAITVADFASGVRLRLSTGMTGFDTTWYHAPFAAGFFQSGNTFDLHFIAPQFLAWFYPANSEVFHAIGMLAFDRDVASPFLNLLWLAGCLLAAWCIGRPYGVAPLSLAAAAIALDAGAFADQAGEARNDIVGAFFLLAAVAIALNARPLWPKQGSEPERWGPPLIAGLAVGLAAGTKLNFLLPAAVLVFGLALVAPRGGRLRGLAAVGLPALAAGGYWYLRNLVQVGNPLPWITSLGLPGPEQALGGREGHSVLGYLTDGTVWADWLLPGLRDGFGVLWPALLLLAALGLALCLGRRAEAPLKLAALAGIAAAMAWAIAPTSASGPAGSPQGFESGLRYLVPAIALGLALLPASPRLRGDLSRLLSLGRRTWEPPGRPLVGVAIAAILIASVGAGYAVQRRYLENRYADPGFTAPGLGAAFEWARDVSDSRIATTSTRQYPFFGTDLSNRVAYVGQSRPHGGFVPITNCRAWITALNQGNYDYVVASRDRIQSNQPPYPPQAAWTADGGAELILRKPPTAVYEVAGPLSTRRCP